jgi:enoyl-CoA hydratase/carnithine racemase
VPAALFVVEDTLEESGLDDGVKSASEDVAGDAKVAREVTETTDAEKGLAKDQKDPALAPEDVDRSLDGVGFETVAVALGEVLRHRIRWLRKATRSMLYCRVVAQSNHSNLRGQMTTETRIRQQQLPADFENSGFDELILDKDGPIARLTLNRPKKRNALSRHLSNELVAAIELIRRAEDVKILVIDGAGQTFCAGDDITEMHDWGDANQTMSRVQFYQHLANSLEELDKVSIAKVDGYAVGGGLEITMACDFVVATRRARWGMPEVDVGITPGWGGTTRMARLIGRRMTKEINLLGALHPASRAVELGLWNRVVGEDELEWAVEALIQVLLSKNQQAVRQLKLIINKGVEADLHTAQGFELLSAGLTAAVNGAWEVPDADHARGVDDFIEKGELWRHRRGLARDFWADAP